MELWSKGLGRRVLGMALGERTCVSRTSSEVAVEGIMHAPTYWEYAVLLDGQDVVDFLGVLEQPDAVRFVVRSESFGRTLGTAAVNAVKFLANTVVAMSGRDATPSADVIQVKEWGGQGYVPDEEDESADAAALAGASDGGS